jgi:hypothetical protein
MRTTFSRVSRLLAAPAAILLLGFSPGPAAGQDNDRNNSGGSQNADADDDRPSNSDRSNDEGSYSERSMRGTQNNQHKALGVILNEDGAGNLYIRRVVRGSPAEQAGLRQGDEILTVDGQRVHHPDEMRRAIARAERDAVKVGILRRGRHQTISATVAESQDVFGRGEPTNAQPMYSGNTRRNRVFGRNRMTYVPNDQGFNQNYNQDRQYNQGGRNADDDEAGMYGQSNRGGRNYHRGAALGIALDQGPRRGAWITDVFPYSPAEEAGIRPGDEILAIDGDQVASADDVIAIISQKQPGENVSLDLDRNGRERTVNAQLVRHEELVRNENRGRSDRRMEQSRRTNRGNANDNYDGGNSSRDENSNSDDDR